MNPAPAEDDAAQAPPPGRFRGPLALVARAALGIGLVTGLVRLLGLLKNQVIAAEFGVGRELECFLFAEILLTFSVGVLSNALPAAFVPAYRSALEREGREAARRLFSAVSGWALLVLLATAALLVAAWPFFLHVAGGNLEADERLLATRLFWLLVPGLVLHGLAALSGAGLNAEKRFLAPVVALGLIPLSISVAAVGFAEDAGAHALASGYLIGVLLELLFVAWSARRAGLPIALGLPRRDARLGALLGQYLPVFGGTLLMRSTIVVDQSMASNLPAGSLAALNYANVIVAALLGVGAAALSTAVLPHLSDLAAQRHFVRMRGDLVHMSKLVFAATLPMTGLVIFFARPLVALLFERGAFRPEDTDGVRWIFAFYALQIPFYTVGVLCAQVVSSLRANHVLFWIAGLNLVLNVGLNLALIPVMGVAGIALSTAIVYLVGMVALWLGAQRLLVRGDGATA